MQPCSTPGAALLGRRRDAYATWVLTHFSFLLLWSAVLIMYPTSLAVISMTFSNYVLQPVFPNCIPPATASRVLSMACLSECPPWGGVGPPLGEEGRAPPAASPMERERHTAGYATLLQLRLDVAVARNEGLGLGRPPAPSPFLPSAPDVGEQLQRALGHTHPGHLHGREAAGPVAHHRHGLCPDLPR